MIEVDPSVLKQYTVLHGLVVNTTPRNRGGSSINGIYHPS